MDFSSPALVPFIFILSAAWLYITCLSFSGYRKFRKSGDINLSHILRAVLWGEIGVFFLLARSAWITLTPNSPSPSNFVLVSQGLLLLISVTFLLITIVDAIYLFSSRHIQEIAEEHRSRIAIGRMAARLHHVSERLDARNQELERLNTKLEAAESKFRDFFEHAPLHYHSLDRAGIIVEINRLECQDLGYERKELIGQHVSKLMHPDYLSVDQKALRDFFRTGIHMGTEVVLAKKNGEAIYAKLYATALRDEKGSISGARTIWTDITAQKRAEKQVAKHTYQLAVKNRELKAKNIELSDLIHVISHDLKAPLRGIEAFLGFLEEDCGSNLNSNGLSHIAVMQDSCRRLRKMIDDLIEYAQFGREGNIELVSLDEILQGVLRELRLQIQAKRVKIDLPSNFPRIQGDKVQLSAMMRNLLVNAIAYGHPQFPRIEIGYFPEADENSITLYVRDNGIGIAKEHQTKIFGLFQRLHGPGKYSGNGIGLAVVKKAVDFHQGEIRVRSVLTRGSTFYITLPKLQAASRDAASEKFLGNQESLEASHFGKRPGKRSRVVPEGFGNVAGSP